MPKTTMVDSVEVWSLQQFLETFEPHVSPELLVNIFAAMLKKIEECHRAQRRCSGLQFDNILIDKNGEVKFTEHDGDGDRADDLFELAALFQEAAVRFGRSTFKWGARRRPWQRSRAPQTNLHDAARIHPRLKEIFIQATAKDQRRRYKTSWRLRADLLDFLTSLGVEGERFSVKNFVRDPVKYNQDLNRLIGAREGALIERSALRGRRSVAMSELKFLLEIDPGSPKTLYLLRLVKEGRKRVVARIAYAALLVAMFVIGSTALVTKIGIAVRSKLDPKQPLVIEPVPPVTSRDGSRSLSSETTVIEINQTERPLLAHENTRPKQSAVLLKLDSAMRAYFDGFPNVARPYKNGDSIWLGEGPHTVTIIKPGLPQAIAQVDVKAGRVITLTAVIENIDR